MQVLWGIRENYNSIIFDIFPLPVVGTQTIVNAWNYTKKKI